MGGNPLTYAKAGVSVGRGDRFVEAIAPLARAASRPEVLASVGGFAALSRLPRGLRDPLLVVSTDGVGTKILLARDLGKYTTVGIDLVAMSVNDVLTVGAEPLLFLDYWATGRIRIAQGRDLVSGVARGCREAGCALVGGETAEMPGLYRANDFDLAGFCVGVVERRGHVDGSLVREGDAVLGLPSSGPHSNGYSLIRRVLRRGKVGLRSRPGRLRGRTVGEALLAPTKIYVRPVLRLLRQIRPHAMAHITGGGLEGNVPRAFPAGLHAGIDRRSWKVPAIFDLLQEAGNISDGEMFRTFNMGIGFALVVPRGRARAAVDLLPGARRIGEIVKGRGESSVFFTR